MGEFDTQPIELLKHWWEKLGNLIIILVLLIIIGEIINYYYRQAQENKLSQASTLYMQLLLAESNQNAVLMTANAHKIITQYPTTPYASLAYLELARQAVNANQLEAAEQDLRWVILNTKNINLRAIARIRAARVLTAENKPAQAIALLEEENEKKYTAAAEEVKGDIFLLSGDKKKAAIAYKLALESTPSIGTLRPLLHMKLSEAGGDATLYSTQILSYENNS